MKPSRKILVVDDDPAILRLLEMTLGKAGYSVLVSAEGTKAITIARENLPDLIIMDLILNDMDGAETVYELKQHEETRKIPVIYLTGLHSKTDEAKDGNMIGGQVVFAKPFDQKQLIQKIEELLNGSTGTVPFPT